MEGVNKHMYGYLLCSLIFYMLPTYYYHILHILTQTLNFIEYHPVLIGVMVAVSSAIGINGYLHQKRINACFGFYCALSLLIRQLKEIMDTYELFTESSPNIFGLHYIDSVRSSEGDKNNILYPRNIDVALIALSPIATNLKNILLSANNNVPPRKISTQAWYEHQKVIFELCSLILKEYNKHLERYDSNKPKHIEMYKKTYKAIEEILDSIEYEQHRASKKIFRKQCRLP